LFHARRLPWISPLGTRGVAIAQRISAGLTNRLRIGHRDYVPVPTFGPRTVCTKCGTIGADVRPNWQERTETSLERFPGGEQESKMRAFI
jgi:hypothetical protein